MINWILKKNKFLKDVFKKIKNDFCNVQSNLSNQQERVSVLADTIVSKNEIKLMIENAVLKSQSHRSLNKSQNKIETKLINRIRRTKQARVVAEISKLMPSLSIPEIKLIIVDQKGFCSKASFYRYIKSLKSQKIETETNLKQLNKGVIER